MFINISLILAQLLKFGMSVKKLSVTLIRQIYNNFRHSKALHTKKNCILFGQNTGKILSIQSESKKDKKITSSKT